MNKLKLQQCAIFQKHYTTSVIIPSLKDVVKAINSGEIKNLDDMKAQIHQLINELSDEYGAKK